MQQVMGRFKDQCSPARVNSKQLLSTCTCMSCVHVPRSLVNSNAACLHEYVCVCAHCQDVSSFVSSLPRWRIFRQVWINWNCACVCVRVRACVYTYLM